MTGRWPSWPGPSRSAPPTWCGSSSSATGLPLMAYLGLLRVETAADLLLRTDEPVTSIARAVGWPDQSHFARRFKAYFGLSATTYRNRFRT